MIINEAPLQHWMNNFYGYGSWDASFWFVAHEEGGGDLPEEVAERINYFGSIPEAESSPILCDLREMYRRLEFRWEGPKADSYENHFQYRFDENAVQHNVWKNLISFVHGYRKKKLPDLLAYQKTSFASSSQGNEALIRLYPLPAPHNHGWYYSWLDLPRFPFLKSRALYEDHLFQKRFNTIAGKMIEHKPDVVLMYGMTNITRLKESVKNFFPAVKFSMIKAIKQHIPQHHRADINGTTLIITTQIPALRHNRIETGFDWEAFGVAARNARAS